MKIRAFGLAIVAVLSVFETSGQTNATDLKASIPDDLRGEITKAEILGSALYTNDMLAAWGTDVVLAAKLSNGDRCRGWITRRQENTWKVHFMGVSEGQAVELWTVDFPEFASKGSKLHVWPIPLKPDAELAAMYQARRTALKSPKFIPRTEKYNPVVLPAALTGQPGWFVYMLAALMDPKAIVVGGHYCMHVSEDGNKILQVRPLSRAFLVLQKEADIGAASVTHFLDKTPIETHVYLSLLHQPVQFYVSIPDPSGVAMMWYVKGGAILPVVKLKYR
jgi:hypothetical protein